MAHEIDVKVRFCETDALGHISNISYFIYLEEARTDFFGEMGFEMGIGNWKFILASATCDFVSQGYFNQRLKVVSEISRIGNSSFTIVHRIEDDRGKRIANGEASIVFFDFDKQKSERLPDWFRETLTEHLAAASEAG
ncbi:acyl-CoA thioesterase [Planococcus lenghuensis]|uniref:Thioesterase n=1 Tax=Planococcus lenghuensis TaxID=2213202 RepID=A0A1Q2KUU9_9BACL|nr:thioesterase family protein [Planococcus lenghuensis]AQQ51971.1 thioesterase [Planococcus lenghuensis]